MATLPIELWQQICSSSNGRSLKSLRLVNRVFGETAARALFEEVYVAMLEDSLCNLQHVAAHPVLRKHVINVSFLNAVMIKYDSYDIWKANVDLRDDCWMCSGEDNGVTTRERMNEYYRSPKIVLQDDIIPKEHIGVIRNLTVSEDYLKDCYRRYSRLCSEQASLIHENVDIRKTVLAIRALPNLQSVQSDEILSRPKHNFFDALSDVQESPAPFLSRLQRATLLKYPFVLYDSHKLDVSSSDTARSLGCMISAMSRLDGPSRLRSIAINSIPWCFWQRDLEISYWDYYQFIVPKALQNVRDMNIRFRIDYLGDYSRDPTSVLHQIVSFLSVAQQVEVLKLTFYNADNTAYEDALRLLEWEHRLPDVSEVFKQITWSNLKWLKLGTCAMSEDAFLGFIRRHIRNLKTFEANILHMTDLSKSWQHAMETIAPVITRTDVRIKRLQDEELKSNAMADRHLPRKAATMRQKAYHVGLSEYLRLGGKAQYPIWGQLDDPTSES